MGVPTETKFRPARVTVMLDGAAIAEPVLMDLLVGKVYSLSHNLKPGPMTTKTYRWPTLLSYSAATRLCI